jgi:hypothetical protein
MLNLFKSGTTISSGTIRKNNFIIAVDDTIGYGPTSSTGFWAGITPPSGGYTIYNNKADNGPSIFTSTNDNGVITAAKALGGTNINTIYDALSWFNGQSDRMVTNIDYPSIVTSGLSAMLDAGYIPSYPESGSTVYDLSGNGANGTLNGTVTWVSSGVTGEQSYFNFATASDSNYISSSVSQTYLDCTVVIQPDFTLVSGANLAGLISNGTPASATDVSLRFNGANGTGPWSAPNAGNTNDWASGTATTYYRNGTVSNTLVSGWNIFGGYRTNQSPPFPLSFAYYLGSSAYPSRSYQGKIAVVLLYNRQLSAAEQLQNYNALKSRFGLP